MQNILLAFGQIKAINSELVTLQVVFMLMPATCLYESSVTIGSELKIISRRHRDTFPSLPKALVSHNVISCL